MHPYPDPYPYGNFASCITCGVDGKTFMVVGMINILVMGVVNVIK